MVRPRSILSPLTDVLRVARENPMINLGLRSAIGARPWRARVPEAVWKRVPVVGEFKVEVPGTPGFVYAAHGEPLGKTLFWKGIDGFEPGSARVFLTLAGTSRCLFDVGAYSGYYTLLGLTANPGLTAHCFEPVAEISAWLARQLERNGLVERARIERAAVTERPAAETEFYVGSSLAPGSSLIQGYHGGEMEARKVRAASLDEYVEARSASGVDLLKIDTEGAELSVLQGARKLLQRQRPLILCEILESNREHLEALERLLGELGYVHGHITEARVVRQPRLSPDPTRRLRNFLLWSAERPPPASILAA